MTKTKNLFLVCALSFFIINLGVSIYFFNMKNISSVFKIAEKINYFDEMKIYFPNIDDLIVTDINSSSFAIKGVIKNNDTIYNIINYFEDNKVEIKTLVIEPAQSFQRSMNIKLVLTK
jgi:hypothetical protein